MVHFFLLHNEFLTYSSLLPGSADGIWSCKNWSRFASHSLASNFVAQPVAADPRSPKTNIGKVVAILEKVLNIGWLEINSTRIIEKKSCFVSEKHWDPIFWKHTLQVISKKMLVTSFGWQNLQNNHRENIGKTFGMEGPLRIHPIYTIYHLGIYWVYRYIRGAGSIFPKSPNSSDWKFRHLQLAISTSIQWPNASGGSATRWRVGNENPIENPMENERST